MFEFDDIKVNYPLGEHDFRELRRKGQLYVDKTQYVARLVTCEKFVFLSRPRRFGKSLLLSTIEYYFRGEKELFEGTWIGEREKDWEKYPVLHFDMTQTKGLDAENMNTFIHHCLEEYEKSYGVEINNRLSDVGLRFSTLIKAIYSKTNKQVVILIDEYDKGILETLDASESAQEAMSAELRAFYSQPKATTKYIKFCMVTGVARFGSYTLFSGPNNYTDISMNTKYAAICGITQQELNDYFKIGIEDLATEMGWNIENTLSVLRQKYDSYRFTHYDILVYNPFSLLNVFNENKVGNYWIKSGTSKVFVKYLTRSEFDLMELKALWVDQQRMEGKYTREDSIPLLFQTGYLTIKEVDCDERGNLLYRLDIPNGEVRNALVDQLMPLYMGISDTEFTIKSRELKRKFNSGDVPGWISELKSMISKIPYRLFNPGRQETEEDKANSIIRLEKTYHIIVMMIFQMLSIDARSEMSVSGGSIDMVAQTNRYVYVMEFKLDGASEEALAQIDTNGYALPWCADGRTVYKIGIVFSSEYRTISDYQFVKQ